ncbi:uncharacterized protein E5676_scaffold29G00860 [Cucumis melo var. makuwa]|uniref:Reverse transcriptase n=1 Tax=Cucumis melo var. makuwa TaxID=1194695 RepID=A0A5D3BRJ1_CUCMM|nr:uncharacterized protein E5676_scaffold29G00860 [Cucumis melo var. makuwa]
MVDSGATHNFITETEARRLRLRWEKDSERMKAVNFVALPIVGLVKRTTIKLGGWKGPLDFVAVKMDDFDVVLGMEFLLEHQVIPMPSAKCLAITKSFPTARFSPKRNHHLRQSCLGRWKSQGRQSLKTVPKDTLCVPEKCHDVLPNSWPKSVLMRRTIDHEIELLPEAKASAKNAYRMAPPELAKLRKPSKMLLNTGFSRPVPAQYGVHVLSLKKKDRSPQQRIDRRIQSKLTVRCRYPLLMLTRQVDRPCGVKYLPKSDIRSRYCRVRTTKAKGLETTYVSGHEAYELPVVPLSLTCNAPNFRDVSFGITRLICAFYGTTRLLCRVRAQRGADRREAGRMREGHMDASGFLIASADSQINVLGHVRECPQSGLLREEDTQWSENLECQAAFNGSKQAMIEGPSLGVVDMTKTPKVEAEQLAVCSENTCIITDSLIKRSPFEIKGKRHSVLPSLTDGPYVGDHRQVHRVGEECEQIANIARVCLEEASRPIEEREDQK